MNKILFILAIFTYFYLSSNTKEFDDVWKDMQIQFQQNNKDNKKFYSEFWINCQNNIKNMLQGKPNLLFLHEPNIFNTMIRMGFEQAQIFEECFLDNCISQLTKEKLKKFKETHLLNKSSTKYDCSATSLGHLYYTAKILENFNQAPKTIIEFGGGFGNLAKIFKSIFNDVTIVIIDSLEVLAIQYLFLSYTANNNIKIKFHNQENIEIENGIINLVPVYYAENLKIKTDIFVSTFALTESSQNAKDLIFKKSFFNADLVYITGELLNVDIIQNLRSMYSRNNIFPFHISTHLFEAICSK